MKRLIPGLSHSLMIKPTIRYFVVTPFSNYFLPLDIKAFQWFCYNGSSGESEKKVVTSWSGGLWKGVCVCVCRGAGYTDNILQFTSKPFYKTQLIHKFWFEHLKVWCHSFIFPAKIEDVSSWIPCTCWTMNKESLPSRTLVVPGAGRSGGHSDTQHGRCWGMGELEPSFHTHGSAHIFRFHLCNWNDILAQVNKFRYFKMSSNFF